MQILATPESVTPERLTPLLLEAGFLREGRVTGVRFEAIGVGLLGDTMRFHLEYDSAQEAAPRTIAGKFPAADPHARKSAKEIGVYMTEVRFYQQIADSVRIRAPGCYYAEIDPETVTFGLLLEDVGPARAADQMTGCSRADAEHALRQAAALHAPRLGDASLWTVEWMKTRYRVYGGVCEKFRSEYLPIFRERFGGMLEPEYLAVAEGLAENVGAFALEHAERFSLIHGDFRLDNMLFDCKSGEVPLVVLDWQSVAPANPGLDTAYFMGTSYPMELRSADEADLLRLYHDQMLQLGARDYSWDAIWHDYRRGAWLGLLTAVFASAVSKRTPRSDAMFLRMARGSAAQMLEHDTLGLARAGSR